MIISHKYKFIFFSVGKTGSRSIQKVLEKYDDGFELTEKEKSFFLIHVTPDFIKNKMDEKVWDSYYKFAFVRNTWDWVISQMFFNRIVERDTDKIQADDINKTYEHIKKYRRGVDWCEHKSQYAFLTDKNGKLLVDFIGKFENFQKDFDLICDKVGIPKESLPLIGASRHKNYKEYYTPETVDLVGKLWKEDIKNLNFKYSH